MLFFKFLTFVLLVCLIFLNASFSSAASYDQLEVYRVNTSATTSCIASGFNYLEVPTDNLMDLTVSWNRVCTLNSTNTTATLLSWWLFTGLPSDSKLNPGQAGCPTPLAITYIWIEDGVTYTDYLSCDNVTKTTNLNCDSSVRLTSELHATCPQGDVIVKGVRVELMNSTYNSGNSVLQCPLSVSTSYTTAVVQTTLINVDTLELSFQTPSAVDSYILVLERKMGAPDVFHRVESSIPAYNLGPTWVDTKFQIDLDPDTLSLYWICDTSMLIYSKYTRNKFLTRYTSEDLCVLGNCTFCDTAYKTAICGASNFGWLNILIVVVLGLVLLCALPWVLTVCGFCYSFCDCCCFRPCRAMKDRLEARRIQREQDKIEVEMQEAPERHSKVSSGKTWSSKQGRWVDVVLLVLIFSPLVLSCHPYVLSSTTLQQCVVDGSTKVCSYNLILSVDLPGVGSELCLDVLTPEGDYIQTVNITYGLHTLSTSKTFLYSMSDWTAQVYDSKMCFLDACCTYNQYGNCQAILTAGLSNPCGFLPHYISSVPHKVGCNSYPGCIGNGCFSCADSCNLYGWTIQPKSPYYDGFLSGDSIIHSRAFEIQTGITTSRDPDNAFLMTSNTFIGGNFTVEYIGSFSPEVTFSFPKTIIVDESNTAYIATINDPNDFTPGQFGDVQSSSRMALQGQTSYFFDSSLVTANPNARGNSFIVKQSGVSRGLPKTKLPSSYQGAQLYYDGTMMRASLNDSTSVALKITFNYPGVVRINVVEHRPVCTQPTLQGCYDCRIGAQLNFTCSIETGSESCYVSAPGLDIVSPRIYLTGEDREFSLDVLSSTDSLATNVTIDCGLYNTTFSVAATFFRITDIVANDGGVLLGIPTTGSMNIVPDNAGGVPDLVIIIICVVIGVLLLITIITLIVKCRPKKFNYTKLPVG